MDALRFIRFDLFDRLEGTRMDQPHIELALLQPLQQMHRLPQLQLRRIASTFEIDHQIEMAAKRLREATFFVADAVVDVVQYLRLADDEQRILGTNHRRIGREDQLLLPIKRCNPPFGLGDGADMPIGKRTSVRDEHLHDLPLRQTDILGNDRDIGKVVKQAVCHQLSLLDHMDRTVMQDRKRPPAIQQDNFYFGID